MRKFAIQALLTDQVRTDKLTIGIVKKNKLHQQGKKKNLKPTCPMDK